MRIFLCIFFSSIIFLNADVSTADGVEWVQIQDPRTGQTFPALFLHPQPGQRLPAVIYHHGKIIEKAGYEAVIAMSPARPKDSLTKEALANIQAPVLVTLGQKDVVDFLNKCLKG